MNWISNHIAVIFICIALIAIVCLIIRSLIKDKKAGKSHCGCKCSECVLGGESCGGNIRSDK